MRRSVTFSFTTVPLAALVGLAAVACTDLQQPTEAPSMTAESGVAAAHMPKHGRQPLVAAVLALPSYAALDGASVGGAGGALHLSVDASGEIPRHADDFVHSVAVFGYAWADLDTGRGIVAVIHPTIGRDSRQNPAGWHTHPVELTAGTTALGGTSDFCLVSIGRSQAGIAIRGDELSVHIADRWAGIAPAALDVAAAFVVQADAGCSATGLGVDVLDTETL